MIAGSVMGADGCMHEVEAASKDGYDGEERVVFVCDKDGIAMLCSHKYVLPVPPTCLWCAGKRRR